VAVDVKTVSSSDLIQWLIGELGLNADALGIDSVEVLSALVRRTAGLLCPCPKKTILNTIMQSLDGVVSDLGELRDTVDDVIDTLVAHGDLLEHNDITADSLLSEIVINRAPLAFVRRQSGACVMLGVTPDDRHVLQDFLQNKIEYNNFSRVIPAEAAPNVSELLSDLGFIELSYKTWSRCPEPCEATRHIEIWDRQIESLTPSCTEVEGLRIIDPTTSVNYYPARWVTPGDHTGRFVGRRPQAYGADLWCYIELQHGRLRRFLDLPSRGSRWRGCDEAWRLQAAIDASHANPQKYKVRDGAMGYKVLDLLSPVPSWAQRRWVIAGMSVPRHNCLISFRFRSAEMEEEIEFAKGHLWLSEIKD
jgi:hypothetical protein